MPAELLSLREQLQNLQIVYEDALANKKPAPEIERLHRQILDVQEKIIRRHEMLNKSNKL